MRTSSREPSDFPTIAYFSVEVGLDPAMPAYSGGVGVLAGDTLPVAADLDIPMVGVTLLHRKGYFCQHLNGQGNQSESPWDWSPGEFLEPLRPRISVSIEGREVKVRTWRRFVVGVSGHTGPVYFLDTDLPENGPWDRAITDQLYGGDERYRLCQEAVLGLGAVAMISFPRTLSRECSGSSVPASWPRLSVAWTTA